MRSASLPSVPTRKWAGRCPRHGTRAAFDRRETPYPLHCPPCLRLRPVDGVSARSCVTPKVRAIRRSGRVGSRIPAMPKPQLLPARYRSEKFSKTVVSKQPIPLACLRSPSDEVGSSGPHDIDNPAPIEEAGVNTFWTYSTTGPVRAAAPSRFARAFCATGR
jgi:hypothetical protein